MRPHNFVALLLCACTTLLCGCIKSFDPASFVDKLRLLAVKAEPPEIAPGQTTTLTATFANPGGTTPSVTWDACLLPPPPATGQGVNQDCVALGAGSDKLVHFGDAASVTATMPSINPTMVGLPDQTNGIYLPVRVRLDADGSSLVSFYSLRIYLGVLLPDMPPPNRNPAFTGIYVVPSADAGADEQTAIPDKSPREVHDKDELALRALVTPDSAEMYKVYDGDPRTTPPRDVTEDIRISWYTTAGEFTNEATGIEKPDTTLKLDKHLPPSGTPIDIWAVARDERGGMDVIHRQLVFR
jgi:hypothetical protein